MIALCVADPHVSSLSGPALSLEQYILSREPNYEAVQCILGTSGVRANII